MSIPTLFLATSLFISVPHHSQEDASDEIFMQNTTCTLADQLQCTLVYLDSEEASPTEYAVRIKGKTSGSRRVVFNGKWSWSIELISKAKEDLPTHRLGRDKKFVLSMMDINSLLGMLSPEFKPAEQLGVPGAKAGDEITWISSTTNSNYALRIGLDFLLLEDGQWSHQLRMASRVLAPESELKFLELLRTAKAGIARVAGGSD